MFLQLRTEVDLENIMRLYRVPGDLEFHISSPHERACFPRENCTTLHFQSFNAGMRLRLDPFYRRVLRAYGLALAQVSSNGWSQMERSFYLWFRHSLGFEKPLHVFQTVYLPEEVAKKKDKGEEAGLRVGSGCLEIGRWMVNDPEPDLDVSSFYGVVSEWLRGEERLFM
ncbi:RNase H domain-containing protein [Abeliophyllum distichum]|uniref:RNase H domain-containing protein n=1 Tax=Abeliophyllum distichum TaxID=126358 RepID=A0ABD1PDY5_9LAMI